MSFKDLFIKSEENSSSENAPVQSQQVNIPPRAFTMTGDYSPTEQSQSCTRTSGALSPSHIHMW